MEDIVITTFDTDMGVSVGLVVLYIADGPSCERAVGVLAGVELLYDEPADIPRPVEKRQGLNPLEGLMVDFSADFYISPVFLPA